MTTERKSILELREDPRNPREMAKENAAGLAVSTEEYGDISGITFNRRTKQLVTGHQRVRTLNAAGASDIVMTSEDAGYIAHPKTGEHFAVRFVDWPEEKQRGANLTANNPHIGGEFTEAALAQLRQLEDQGLAEALRLSQLEEDLAEQFDDEPVEDDEGGEDVEEDNIPEPPATPTTKLGDLWVCGQHRLLCGDSFEDEARARLFGSDGEVHLVVTDPPYAIYGSSTGIGADIADDKMVRPFFVKLFQILMASVRQFGHIYVFCDWRSWAAIWEGARQARCSPKNCLVWDKGGGGLGSMYAQTHELVGFFSRLPPATAMTSSQETGQRTVFRPNILRHNRPTGDERRHNAAKPVPLVVELLENSSDTGDLVLDLFGGSGTTMIAAEKVGRRARLMEMEPRFCDVIVARWEQLTGEKAYREDRK